MSSTTVKRKKLKNTTDASPPVPAVMKAANGPAGDVPDIDEISTTPAAPVAAPTSSNIDEPLECCICVEQPDQPIKLPCSHIFCFLCIKGVYQTDGLCPLCRAPIPSECIEQPVVFGESPVARGSKKRKKKPISSQSGNQDSSSAAPSTPTSSQSADLPSTPASPPRQVWLYQGHQGWWQFDARTQTAIEEAVAQGLTALEVLLAGHIYMLDFVANVQMRKDNPTSKRQIKKDVVDGTVKGIAGIYFKKEE